MYLFKNFIYLFFAILGQHIEPLGTSILTAEETFAHSLTARVVGENRNQGEPFLENDCGSA
jgi:hypothetical protein